MAAAGTELGNEEPSKKHGSSKNKVKQFTKRVGKLRSSMNRVRELRNKIGKLGSSRKGVRELRNSAANFMGL